MAGVYVHIPFCASKCLYCSFNSYVGKLHLAEEYVEKVISEIKTYKELEVDTVYFGGGTPTVLKSYLLIKILDTVKDFCTLSKNSEITIEANPGTCDQSMLYDLKKAGFNRLSLGLQSMNDGELSALGRIHTSEQGIKAVKLAQDLGFENISGDIMTAIPNQTIESLSETINVMISLGLKHISAYSLSIEEGTPFFKQAKHLNLPSEDLEREMYYFITDRLSKAGFNHYEISNYAKKGFESRHNTAYWTGNDYVGVGAGAHSLYKNKRFSNVCHIDEYIYSKDIISESYFMDDNERKKEYYMLGLRQIKGVRDDGNPKVNKLIEDGLLVRENGNVRLTRRGIDVSNYVFMELM